MYPTTIKKLVLNLSIIVTWLQVGVTNDGKLNGIDMNLYADCSSSPNDLDVAYAETWVDNGKYAWFS